MAETLYWPVPHWSLSGAWEPIHEPSGQPWAWPAGFDPARLPRPRYSLRDRVRFRWRHRHLRGEVRDIKLGGGPYVSGEAEATLIELHYLGRRPEYIIYTGGHGYWVPEEQLE